MGTEPILCYSGITTPMATTTPMLTAKVTPLPTTPEANLRNTMDVANVSGRGVIVGGGNGRVVEESIMLFGGGPNIFVTTMSTILTSFSFYFT